MRTIPPDVKRDAARVREAILRMGRRRSLRDPFFTTCEALKLTPPQFHALMWLGHDGALNMGELSRRVGISEKTMTGVVDRLERSGHALRARDGEDRRVIRVRLTRRGSDTFRKLDAQLGGKVAGLLSLLDATDRAALVRIMERLDERFAQHAATLAGEEAA